MGSVPQMAMVLGMVFLGASTEGAAQGETDDRAWQAPFRIGGCGGAYFLASPGEFWVEVEKQDLDVRGRCTHLRAILFGPDRHVLDEQWLPDDGKEKGSGPGPIQRMRLSTVVPRTGIYGLNITVTEDRYGEDFAWGFRTNCPRYLVETSRGHKDAPHEEPLVLLDPDAPGDVCFMPRRGAFAVEVTGLPDGVDALHVYNGKNEELAVVRSDGSGKATHSFPAAPERDATPWRLHLPKFRGVVHIDGVTRWTKDDDFPNLSLWTPNADSWFAFPQNRWLLTPYSRLLYGDEGGTEFQVHNNDLAEKTVTLALEFPDGETWPVELETEQVTLPPGQSAAVPVHWRLPDGADEQRCHLRVTPLGYQEVTTYSTLTARRGTAPAADPIAIPLVLKPYQHENEQFGYVADYPLTNQVYFDVQNRPVVSNKNGIAVWRDGAWLDITAAARPGGEAEAFRPAMSKAAFDEANGLYCIATAGDARGLVHLADGDMTAAFYPIPGSGGSFDIEQFSGHNLPPGPPPFVRFTLTAKDPKVFWRRLNDLELFLPKKEPEGAITIGEPVLLSKKCIGLSAHSGIPSSVVSRGAKVHVAWAEATEPDEDVPGVPTFVATYDRETGTASEPAPVGYGPPANDCHNTPCITMDSQGYLHVLVGTHGRTFKYARSLEANDASGGWTPAEDIGPGLRQTYVGLVCDPEDTLHLVFRLWRSDTDYFPASSYATLAYMRKRPGEAWSEPQPLIVAPFSEYSVFYHRLTIDRAGSLFLSYDYWSTFWFYRTDHWGNRRALLTSPDQGGTWKMAGQADLVR